MSEKGFATPDDAGTQAGVELSVLLRFADLAVAGLGATREEIDALNVYPVPDGDTGTNLFLTLEAARAALVERSHDDVRTALAAYARGALLGARGNSGVILSELVGALFRHLSRSPSTSPTPGVIAAAMDAAATAGYAAVGIPVEGTILSVARAAADAALRAAEQPDPDLAGVIRAATSAAHEAVARTPEQLELLRQAGVVDAGGRGLCVVLDAAESAITGKFHQPSSPRIPAPSIPVVSAAHAPGEDLTEGGPAYEVMYLLECDDESIGTLKARLAGLGDSLVVVGGERLWNVHVHVDDVGAAIEAGIQIGTPSRIRVTHFAEQVEQARASRVREGRCVVALAGGPGLADLFAEAGAVVITGRRPSTGEIVAALESSGAREVIVLPNDPDSVPVAEAAARAVQDSGVKAVVIPTRAQVQGIAALAVHEPSRSLESDVVAMTSAARQARHGAITVAAKRAITSGGPCEPGDVLGAIEGDFVLVGQDQGEVARAILDRLIDGRGELVTLVAGVGAGDLPAALEQYVEQHHRGVDVVCYDGGQERYPLLLAVE